MKDDFFSKKRYEGDYTPVYAFKQYGDTVNYFIKLHYICNRDDYQAIRNPKGASLDFDMVNIDGESIFGDIDSGHLEILQARNYQLLAEPTVESYGNDEKLVRVTELYAYAPDQSFSLFDSDVVPIWGLNDDDYSTSATIVSVVYENEFYGHTVVTVDDASVFATGDTISMTFLARYLRIPGGVDANYYQTSTVKTSNTSNIIVIDGNTIELSTTMGSFTIDYYDEDQDTNEYVQSAEFFYSGFNGDTHDTMTAISGEVIRAYTMRSYTNRLSLTRVTTTYYTDIPTDIPSKFYPCDESGSVYTTISRMTQITASDWKAKIVDGDWFIYVEPTLSYDIDTGLYIMQVKETRCQ